MISKITQKDYDYFTDNVRRGLGLTGNVWHGHLAWRGGNHDAPSIARLVLVKSGGKLLVVMPGDDDNTNRELAYRYAYTVGGATNELTFYLADRSINEGEPPEVVILWPKSYSCEAVNPNLPTRDGRVYCSTTILLPRPARIIEFLSEEAER